MHIERVNLGRRSYDIAVGTGVEDQFAPFVRERLPNATRWFVVADAHTEPHATRLAAQLGTQDVVVVPAGEESKSLSRAAELYDRLADAAADRKTPVVAVGGGVVGDLAGFVAATYNRGLPLLMVPTSLLAMVDSSVGGKVGINLPQGKNLVGAFYQPACVWIDTAFLKSLPDREYRSGLAEVVKYGVILDAEFFSWLEENAEFLLLRKPAAIAHVVARCCRLKADVVEKDEREETGLRKVLNYGHTFAHAFESVAGYGAWLHGEAVSAGMVCAARLAERGKLAKPQIAERQAALLTRFGLPIARNGEWRVDDLLAAMRLDKKNVGGQLRFVLPTRIGRVKTFKNVPEKLVREILAVP
jgi:3-dehydroquinate synthase